MIDLGEAFDAYLAAEIIKARRLREAIRQTEPPLAVTNLETFRLAQKLRSVRV